MNYNQTVLCKLKTPEYFQPIYSSAEIPESFQPIYSSAQLCCKFRKRLWYATKYSLYC